MCDPYRVSSLGLFEDGDHLVIVLKRAGAGWVLTDEAHTYMRLTYDIDEYDLHRGTRQTIISNALSTFQIEDRDGELVLGVPDERPLATRCIHLFRRSSRFRTSRTCHG